MKNAIKEAEMFKLIGCVIFFLSCSFASLQHFLDL